MKLYHGGNAVVKSPNILTRGYYKDFGYGFYCTIIEKQAIRWAVTKKPHKIVNVYNYREDSTLNIKRFDQMSEEWLDFVIDCRRGILHSYDIVEGPMADDTIWNFIESYLDGEITRDIFWQLAKFRYPTHQIVFCTPKAINTIQYERSYVL